VAQRERYPLAGAQLRQSLRHVFANLGAEQQPIGARTGRVATVDRTFGLQILRSVAAD
jgi:hypothetical protein